MAAGPPPPGQMVQLQSMLQQQQQQQQQGPPPPQPLPPPPPSHQMPEQPKLDNISKVKSLIWPLKESLAAVMRVAAQNIYYNAAIDAGLKGADQPPPRFDKCIEEFYAVCDQIELNLKVALDCSQLASSSQRYTPFVVTTNKPDTGAPSDAHTYGQYISVIKMQVTHAKEIHDSLTKAARTINDCE